MAQALQSAVGENRVVVVNLGGLTFCDCTGLSALLAAARTARVRDVELRLCAVPHFEDDDCLQISKRYPMPGSVIRCRGWDGSASSLRRNWVM
ncbi:STAS domain-containing protein [Streptomyces sp. NEAU-YJ-81]|nr:STAS domain-containing protein [Streptomyces sp. NEAU-YJ-81]